MKLLRQNHCEEKMKQTLFCFIAIAFLINSAQAQIDETKLAAIDAAQSKHFGYAVSLYENYALVGAINDNLGTGAVYAFVREANGWRQQAKLVASDGRGGDNFGGSVALNGNHAIIGSAGRALFSNTGAVYIFTRTANGWIEQAAIAGTSGEFFNGFGFAVHLHGDYAIVGAFGEKRALGQAHIYERQGNNWGLQATLFASDGQAGDRFGTSVALHEDYAIIGASYDDQQSGSAYVFRRKGSNWIEQAKLVATDREQGDLFGITVSISSDYAVIGATGDDEKRGAAYIFINNGNSWVESARLTSTFRNPLGALGSSVSAHGELVLVGAELNDDGLGAAYIYQRTESGWIEKNKLSASDAEAAHYFGRSLSLFGDYAIVGAHEQNFGTGAAYIYHGFGSIVRVKDQDDVALSLFHLNQNYPNPFNPSTKISFALPSAQKVTLKVFDLNGKEVAALLDNERKPAGVHEMIFNAHQLPSGVYLYRLEAGKSVEMKKMLLVR